MKKRNMQIFIGLLFLFVYASHAAGHCEIPCGIYDDKMRIAMINEHIGTIEKSMTRIAILEKEKPSNSNQLVRWIMNKENHAREIQEIVSQYFMTQRIKPGAKNYAQKLALLHQMLIYAMKCKQTADTANARELRNLTAAFEGLYFENK